MSTGNIISHRIKSNRKKSSIIRWLYQVLQVQESATLCIATWYCPVLPPLSGGTYPVYTQYLTDLSQRGRNICPRKSFLDNLSNQISRRKEEGYQFILMGDINQYVLGKKITLFSSSLGMRELITKKREEWASHHNKKK